MICFDFIELSFLLLVDLLVMLLDLPYHYRINHFVTMRKSVVRVLEMVLLIHLEKKVRRCGLALASRIRAARSLNCILCKR